MGTLFDQDAGGRDESRSPAVAPSADVEGGSGATSGAPAGEGPTEAPESESEVARSTPSRDGTGDLSGDAAEPAPASEPEPVPVAAPSSAGPAPSRLQALPDLPTPEPIRRPAHKRWPKRPLLPTNVGVDPQQRVYSLVMLLTLAAVVGVVGAGLLVAIVFITIGALGG